MYRKITLRKGQQGFLSRKSFVRYQNQKSPLITLEYMYTNFDTIFSVKIILKLVSSIFIQISPFSLNFPVHNIKIIGAILNLPETFFQIIRNQFGKQIRIWFNTNRLEINAT